MLKLPSPTIASAFLASSVFAFSLVSLLIANRSTPASEAPYRPIPIPEFLSIPSIQPLTPRNAALALFSELTRESEGRRAEGLEIEYPSFEVAIARVTAVGLADDSVRAKRYRLQFKLAGDRWQLVEVGQQFQCWPDRGHQDWGAELCS